MGTPDFAVPSLQALARAGMKPVLCVSQPDRPQGRKQMIFPTPVHAAAEALDIPVFQPTKVRDEVFYRTLASYEPDLIVTAAYGRILPSRVLELPRLGCINVHASLLPRYRGASPVQWAIINGDEETGVSIIRMTEGMDEGAILRVAKHSLAHRPTADQLMKELATLGADILPETVRLLAEGKLVEQAQNHAEAVYVSLLTKETGKISWKKTAREIEQLIRGCTPWPGAYTSYLGKRCKIYKAHLLDDFQEETQQEHPGSRLKSPKNALWIACGQGGLSIDEYQVEGGKRQQAHEAAHNLPQDLSFGEET